MTVNFTHPRMFFDKLFHQLFALFVVHDDNFNPFASKVFISSHICNILPYYDAGDAIQ